MRRLIVRPEAVHDLADAYAWYEAQRRGLGEEFFTAVEARLAAVLQRPQQFQQVTATTRRAMIRRFPYGVFFTVDGDAVVIKAILHSSRNPRLWRRRR